MYCLSGCRGVQAGRNARYHPVGDASFGNCDHFTVQFAAGYRFQAHHLSAAFCAINGLLWVSGFDNFRLATCQFQQLRIDRRIENRDRLVAEIAAWQTQRNRGGARIKWMFTTEKARAKMARAYPKPKLKES